MLIQYVLLFSVVVFHSVRMHFYWDIVSDVFMVRDFEGLRVECNGAMHAYPHDDGY